MKHTSLSTITNPPPHRDRPWMQTPQQHEPATPLTPAEIYTLAATITNTETGRVKAMGLRATLAGQRLLGIDLYRCVERRNGVTQVLVGQLRYVAEQLNAGAYVATHRE